MTAGSDQKYRSLLYLLDGDFLLRSVPLDHRRLGGQLHQTLQRVCSAAFGTGFQHFAYCNQRQYHGRRLKVELHHIIHHGFQIAPDLRTGHGKEGVGAVDKCRRRAQGNQCIHIRRTVPETLESADEKFLVNHHHRRCQQQLQQPHGDMISLHERRYGPVPHHMAHGEIHQNQQESQGPQQTALQYRRFLIPQGFLRLRRAGDCLCPALCRRAVACCLDRRYDFSLRRAALYPHGVCQQAYGTRRYPRHLPYRFLHPGTARRAAHPCYIVLLHKSSF